MEILNSYQGREYNRAQTMQNFFNLESKVYPLLLPFQMEVNIFFNNNKELQSLVPLKNERGNGITKDKAELKNDVASAAGFVCSMATAYAIKINDNNLKSSVDHTVAAIHGMKDGDIFGFVTSLVTTVTPLLLKDDFVGYSITSATLESLTGMASDFNNSIGKAAVVDTSSSIASRNIDEVLKAIRDNIVQFDLLISFFKKDYPDFVAGYQKAIRIDFSGIHHSGIKGIIINSTTARPVVGASVTLTRQKNTKTVLSNDAGAYQIAKFRPGKAKLTITAPNFTPQEIEITIVRGKTLELNFSLQSAAVNLVTA